MDNRSDEFYVLSGDDGRKWEIILTRLLSVPRTRCDLRRRLRARGCPAERCEELLDLYEESGLIDDLAYAVLYVDSKREYGVRRLRDELRARGVERDDIEDALERCGIDEAERAGVLVERWKRLPGMTREKLFDRLRRRGFSGAALREVSPLLDEMDGEDGAGEDEELWQ